MTKKRLFGPLKVTFESLWGSKSLFSVTFESLCRKRQKGEKVSFQSLLGQINDFWTMVLTADPRHVPRNSFLKIC